VNSIIPKPRVSLDPRLHGQDIIILSLEVGRDLLEAISSANPQTRQVHDIPMLIIDALAEAWRIDNGQCNPCTILLLQLDVMLGDTYRVLLVSSSSGLSHGGRVEARVGVFGVLVEGSGTVGEERLVNEGVDKGGSSTARGACRLATWWSGLILADEAGHPGPRSKLKKPWCRKDSPLIRSERRGRTSQSYRVSLPSQSSYAYDEYGAECLACAACSLCALEARKVGCV
jgi:hypothetical protein